jgi:glucosylglycerate synthase
VAEDTFLGDDLLRQLMSVGEVDLLVAIPSFNNANTIGQTVQVIEESYQQNFIRDRVVILNVDGGSTDHTMDVVASVDGRKAIGRRGLTSLRTVHRVTAQYAKSPSPGMALRTVLATADLLHARSCAIISPTTVSVDTSWIANLLRPAYRQDFDFVAPLYARNKYQGLLARLLLYPMSRAIFGKRVRELYCEEWSFSGRLAMQCLGQDVWNDDAVRARPEAWMGINAICSDLKCCQSFLGPKVLSPVATTQDIVEAVRQTVGNLFWCLENYESQWLNRSGSEPVPTFGPEHEFTEDGRVSNQEKIFELFRTGVTELDSVLASILAPDTYAQIKEISTHAPDKFRFDSELWVKTAYEFAASYHRPGVLTRGHVVQALVPLYRGRMYSFLVEHAESSADEVEADSEALCVEFERQKPYLVQMWKGETQR